MLLAVAANGAPLTPDFSGVEIYVTEAPVQPVTDISGLALCSGKLLAVSDKNNDTIFSITLRDGMASIAPALTIPSPPVKEVSYHVPANVQYLLDGVKFPGRQDWEAIACRSDEIYLLSERKNGILKIKNGVSEWLAIDWYESLYQRGLLHEYNAFVEGIAVYDANHLLVAMERNPRGVIELTRHNNSAPERESREEKAAEWRFKNYELSNDKQLKFREDNSDVADIVFYRDAIYTLERNASAVCKRDAATLQATSCFSYAQIENNPANRYADSRYGLGEGLAIDDQWIYIVFDNNDQPRLSNPQDRRSLLLRMPIPEVWRQH